MAARIDFASRSDAQIAFSGSRTGMVKGDAQVIGFNGANKLNSTMPDPNSVYDVTYTDLVGNAGAVVNHTVMQSEGALKIDSVRPAINSKKRIGYTGYLTWTVTCPFEGSGGENAILTIGGNMAQIGRLTMRMDDEGGISCHYGLDEGVIPVSEDVRVYTAFSREDPMEHTGVLLSCDEAAQAPNSANQYCVTAEFAVELEADLLTAGLQLESPDGNDLKQAYSELQVNEPLK